jgi:F-type H+-transporting ATPase subunit epsilon
MELKILLPFGVFVEELDVLRIVAEAQTGAFGILPHRLDCVVALTPGLFVYETPVTGEVFVAIDQGVLVKTGGRVCVSVRNAIGGKDVAQLRAAIDQQFLKLNDDERRTRSVMKKMENDFVRRIIEVRNG